MYTTINIYNQQFTVTNVNCICLVPSARQRKINFGPTGSSVNNIIIKRTKFNYKNKNLRAQINKNESNN